MPPVPLENKLFLAVTVAAGPISTSPPESASLPLNVTWVSVAAAPEEPVGPLLENATSSTGPVSAQRAVGERQCVIEAVNRPAHVHAGVVAQGTSGKHYAAIQTGDGAAGTQGRRVRAEGAVGERHRAVDAVLSLPPCGLALLSTRVQAFSVSMPRWFEVSRRRPFAGHPCNGQAGDLYFSLINDSEDPELGSAFGPCSSRR